MGEVVAFPKKKKMRQRPNRKAGRASGTLEIFPVRRSEDRFKFHGIVLDVAAGIYSVSEALTKIYEAHYSRIRKEDLRREFNHLGWQIHRHASAIRRACGRPPLELPTRSKQRTAPSQSPPPAA